MTVRMANIDFDRVDYDARADVLYLAADDPALAVKFDETPEGHAVRFRRHRPSHRLTIVNARRLLDQNGAIRITLPETISAGCAEGERGATAGTRSLHTGADTDGF